MKRILAILLTASLMIGLLVTAAPVSAAKPAGNLGGAQTIGWNLSADVMPVPPYGSRDIPGSDTASKLIVNQPNGNTEAAITGVMKDLNANTEYTVYLSKGYAPYDFTGWSVAGTFGVNVRYLGVDYPETLILTQNSGGGITGVSLDTVPPASYFSVIGGSVDGTTVTIHCQRGGLLTYLVGTIAPDGSMSGNWYDVAPTGSRTGTWATTSGAAVKLSTGSTGWPGFFTSNIPAFTFTTDEFGAGSWHVNLKDSDLPSDGSVFDLSVWINAPGATILISDPFQVTKG